MNMADDVFGNPSLFQEFEKPRDPSDTILLKKLDNELQEECDGVALNGIDVNESDKDERGVSIYIGSSDTEESRGSGDEDPENENETVSKNGTGRLKCELKKAQHSSKTSICSDTSNKIHKEQIEALKRENARLKQKSKIIDPCKFVRSEDLQDGPAVQLIFLNNIFARKYRVQIEQFIAHLVAQEKYHGTSTQAVPASSVCLVEGDEETGENRMRASTVIGCSQIYRGFVVDSMGWPLVNADPSVSDGWNTPRYEQLFPCALADDDGEGSDGPKKDKKKKAACFNCGAEHILSECKMKKDFSRIQKNRREFQTQQGPRGPKGGRYHVDDPRFSKFQPGVISDELRRALNLKKNQLPQFIYQMRTLGYPPGYLADAQVCTSGIVMFDRHGKAISADGEDPEDGEIDAESDEQKVEYDVNKIVSYPGFNVDPPEGTVDETRKMHVPPMQNHHRKEALEALLLKMSSGTKRSTNDEGGGRQKKLKTRHSEDVETVDMEIADSSGTEEELARDRDGRLAKLRSTRLSSTSLEDLEAEKEMLRRQLAAAEGTDEDVELVIIDSSSDESFVPPLPPTPVRPPLPLNTPPVTPERNGQMPPPFKRTPLKLPKPRNTDASMLAPSATSTPSNKGTAAPVTPQVQPATPSGGDSSTVPSTPENSQSVSVATPSSGGSILMEYGTPVNDADQHLPDPSKFASCISEHIPFENLPNATGTFERVRRVLKKGKK